MFFSPWEICRVSIIIAVDVSSPPATLFLGVELIIVILEMDALLRLARPVEFVAIILYMGKHVYQHINPLNKRKIRRWNRISQEQNTHLVNAQLSASFDIGCPFGGFPFTANIAAFNKKIQATQSHDHVELLEFVADSRY